MSVITAITAQNTLGVNSAVDLSSEIIAEQFDAVFSDIYPDAVKIGMLSNENIMKVVAEKIKEYEAKNIVIDPVMIATSGNTLMDRQAVDSFKKELYPLTDILTPNMAEASVLTGLEVNTKKDMEKAAEAIAKNLKGMVLVKGGAFSGECR